MSLIVRLSSIQRKDFLCFQHLFSILSYYVRQQEDVEFEADKKVEKAWIYILMDFKEELLQRPLLANYSSKGDHGLEYVARCVRDAQDPDKTHYREVKQDSVRIKEK